MDAPALIRQARQQACFTKTRLAARAGTSVSAVVQYEAGRRSPTVSTLSRLLAACGMQVRGELEPLHADVDRVVDDLVTGEVSPPPYGTLLLAAAFDASEVPWALDAASALQAHGLAVSADFATDVVAVDGEALRTLLNDCWARPRDRYGLPILRDWHDLDVRLLGPRPMYTRLGFLRLRLVDALPPVARVQVADTSAGGTGAVRTLPALNLVDVEVAHPAWARVLERLRQRRTVPA